MKLYKNTYDLNDGGSYQPKQMNVSTDSKYAIGVKFIKDGAPVEIAKEDVILKNGEETIEASDVYHNYAVFEMEATSDDKDDKIYSVKFSQQAEYDKTFTGTTGDATTGAGAFTLSTEQLQTISADEINEWNFDLYVKGDNTYPDIHYGPCVLKDIPDAENKLFPVVHNNITNVLITNIALNKRGQTTKMFFVGKDATTGNVGWVNYKESIDKAGQNITEDDFVDFAFDPDLYDYPTMRIYVNNLYQNRPYTLTIKKGETLVARFDNLIVNQNDEKVGSVEPVITDIEVDSVSANSIEVDTVSSNSIEVDSVSANSIEADEITSDSIEADELTAKTYIYDATSSCVKIGDDTYKLEAKTIDDAECLVLVKQVEEEEVEEEA